MFRDFYSPISYIDNSYIKEKSYVCITKVRILYKKWHNKSQFLFTTKQICTFLQPKASAISTSLYIKNIRANKQY